MICYYKRNLSWIERRQSFKGFIDLLILLKRVYIPFSAHCTMIQFASKANYYRSLYVMLNNYCQCRQISQKTLQASDANSVKLILIQLHVLKSTLAMSTTIN